MKKFTLLIASLFITIGAMAQVDYSTRYDGQTKSDRPINSVSIISPAFGESKLTLTSTENTSLVVDRTADITFRCRVGETVTPNTGYTAGWMHTYVYLDADNNGFIVDNETSADLVSFAYYNGKNSNGATVADNVVAAPAFVAPATAGTYRLRFKIDWNSIDPQGNPGEANGNNTMSGNRGGIIDVMLQVEDVPVHEVIYNYVENDVVVGTMTYNVAEGSAYPDVVSGLYGVTVTGSKPAGNVTAPGTHVIAVEIGEMPFEYYEDYAAVEGANGWYNLIMHSNWNTGGGTERYRTYLSHNESGSTLAWGTERSLTNPSNAYYWAFVGNPINGFRVVNKATGAEKVLSSNGTTNPLMTATEGMADGYNTTWQVADRKYDVSTEGDYIREGAWFCLKYPGSNNYINANAGNGNVAFWTDNDNGSGILAVKPLTINAEADLATFYTDNYVKMPSTLGAEVYYATEVVNSNYIHLELISGEVIPAQTGVVVKYAVENNVVYAPEITSQGTTTAVTGNLLKGTTKRTLIRKDANKSYYVLGMTDGVGFYNAVNGENKGEFYNGAFKAYLELPAAQGTAAFYGFDWNGTTGIDEVKGESGNVKVIYDLTGRRVEAITAPGIYVVNGKKVLVK